MWHRIFGVDYKSIVILTCFQFCFFFPQVCLHSSTVGTSNGQRTYRTFSRTPNCSLCFWSSRSVLICWQLVSTIFAIWNWWKSRMENNNTDIEICVNYQLNINDRNLFQIKQIGMNKICITIDTRRARCACDILYFLYVRTCSQLCLWWTRKKTPTHDARFLVQR